MLATTTLAACPPDPGMVQGPDAGTGKWYKSLAKAAFLDGVANCEAEGLAIASIASAEDYANVLAVAGKGVRQKNYHNPFGVLSSRLT